MMFIDFLDGCWYADQNTWNTFPVSEQKIEQWINERNRVNKNRSESKFEMINRMNEMWIWHNWQDNDKNDKYSKEGKLAMNNPFPYGVFRGAQLMACGLTGPTELTTLSVLKTILMT